MTTTETKTSAPAETGQAPAASPPETRKRRQEVQLAGPRLPYPGAAIEERYDVDRSTWKALCESIFPLAKTPEAIILALAYCRARRLDVMKRPCHIVPMWNAALSKEVETVWPGIAELRTTAFRTAQYVGADATAFGETVTATFKGMTKPKAAWGNKPAKPAQEVSATVTFPEWAQVTVYRLGAAGRVAFPGPRIYFCEAFGYDKGVAVPNARWTRAPSQMLEKCAEAAALRKAFPEEFADDYVAEEMEDRPTDVGDPADRNRPARAEFVENGGAPLDGVILEGEGEEEVVVEEEREEEVVAPLAAETVQNPERVSGTPKGVKKPDADQGGDPRPPAPPLEDEVEEEVIEEPARGEEASRPAEPSPFEKLEQYLAMTVEGLKQSDLKTAADFDGYGARVKQAISEFPGVDEDERDDVRARFVSALLNAKRDAGLGRRQR